MNLNNFIVTHKLFGKGRVISLTEDRIEILFANGKKSFSYPFAFEKFLTAENAEIQTYILKQISSILDPLDIESAFSSSNPSSNIQVTKSSESLPISPHLFYVFQGKTFDREYKGGYIWAPIYGEDYRTYHPWDRLLEVKTGDIIFHGTGGVIQAISKAKGECYECDQPIELRKENAWNIKGRKIDCAYTYINSPIFTRNHISDIQRLSQGIAAPFNRLGRGKQGYLFDLNTELAKIFLDHIVLRNPHLKKVDYISALLKNN